MKPPIVSHTNEVSTGNIKPTCVCTRRFSTTQALTPAPGNFALLHLHYNSTSTSTSTKVLSPKPNPYISPMNFDSKVARSDRNPPLCLRISMVRNILSLSRRFHLPRYLHYICLVQLAAMLYRGAAPLHNHAIRACRLTAQSRSPFTSKSIPA